MSEQTIENAISEVLAGDARKNALAFFAYLVKSEMMFERVKGYWKDKLYWLVKYKDEHVCFILVNGSKDNAEPEGWTIWTDDSDSNWFSYFPLDTHMKKIAWNHVDICANCGSCMNPGGSHKTILGKEFNNVCITAMKFINPDVDTLECLIKMAALRKQYIECEK